MRMMLLVLLALTGTHPSAQAQDFFQGPGQLGETRALAGTVIGRHAGPDSPCYLILADGPRAGVAGGGRFFVCTARPTLTVGQRWEGRGQQTGTRRAKLGPRWRTFPVFTPTRR